MVDSDTMGLWKGMTDNKDSLPMLQYLKIQSGFSKPISCGKNKHNKHNNIVPSRTSHVSRNESKWSINTLDDSLHKTHSEMKHKYIP